MGKLPASFQAMGQSYTLSDCSPEARASESPIAAGFRESYRVDPDTGDKRAALVVDLGTIPAVRFVEDSALNETVQIADGRCSRVNMDALNMQNIHLLKDEKGSVAFPVRQMLSLPEPNEQPVRGTCRGQPCVTWTVRQQPVTRKGDDGSLIVSREVYSLVWTDFTAENSWSSMSQERNVPLELRLCRVENVTRPDDNSTETTTQLNVVEILHFTHNAVLGDDLETADDIHDDERPHENWKKLTFSFYRVDSANKWVTDLQAFDITECMDEDIDPMQFELKYPETKYEDVVNITIEPLFLAMCKYHIVQSLNSKFGVLRVGKLRAVFDEEKKLHIQFALLGKFPNIKGEPTLEELQGSLEQDVDAGVLKFNMTAPGKQESIEFTAVPHSLRSADEDFSPSNEPARRPTPVTLFRSGQPGWSVQNVTLDYPMPALLYRSQAHHEPSVASKNGTTGHTKTVHVVIFVGAALGLFAIGAVVGVVSLRLQRIVR
ncbi:hypothetical protein V5799_008149 [Amblyomma americanum]|uniref:Uncharacterized protein n=1 Tax=Amblyomma americanum TaxID=6943 RepID=A0AAQ4FFT7_AMBAM